MRILRVIRWEQHAYDSTAYSSRGISGPGSESDVYDCRMPVGERSIVMSVSVCLSVRKHTKFCACYLWPRLGPFLAALQYVMYFRLYA